MAISLNTPFVIYEIGVAYSEALSFRSGPFEYNGDLYVVTSAHFATDSYHQAYLAAFKSTDGLTGRYWQVHAKGEKIIGNGPADGLDCVFDTITHTVHIAYFRFNFSGPGAFDELSLADLVLGSGAFSSVINGGMTSFGNASNTSRAMLLCRKSNGDSVVLVEGNSVTFPYQEVMLTENISGVWSTPIFVGVHQKLFGTAINGADDVGILTFDRVSGTDCLFWKFSNSILSASTFAFALNNTINAPGPMVYRSRPDEWVFPVSQTDSKIEVWRGTPSASPAWLEDLAMDVSADADVYWPAYLEFGGKEYLITTHEPFIRFHRQLGLWVKESGVWGSRQIVWDEIDQPGVPLILPNLNADLDDIEPLGGATMASSGNSIRVIITYDSTLDSGEQLSQAMITINLCTATAVGNLYSRKRSRG